MYFFKKTKIWICCNFLGKPHYPPFLRPVGHWDGSPWPLGPPGTPTGLPSPPGERARPLGVPRDPGAEWSPQGTTDAATGRLGDFPQQILKLPSNFLNLPIIVFKFRYNSFKDRKPPFNSCNKH